MFRNCIAAFGVVSLAATLGGCGDAGDSSGAEYGESASSAESLAVPKPDPNQIPNYPWDDPVNPTARYRAVAAAANAEIARQGVPGIAVGVIENGKLMWSGGFGRLSPFDPNSEHVTRDTMFRSPVLGIALTKLLALHMADKGEISINEELATYLPDLKVDYDPRGWFKDIAIRHLLTWSSGLPRTQDAWYQATPRDAGLAQWAESKEFANMFVDFPPGRLVAGHSYAEPRLLALIAEKVAGQPFRKLVDARLLEPLGMTRTVYLSGDVTARTVAVGAAPAAAQNAARAAPVWGPYTTIGDMAKFVQFYMNGNEAILSDHVRQLAMYRVSSLIDSRKACGEALVFNVQDPRCAKNGVSDPVVSIDTGVGGFKSAIYMNPDKKFGLVILSNGESWDAMPIVAEAFRLAGIDSRTWQPTPPNLYDMKKYQGTYLTQVHSAYPWVQVGQVQPNSMFFLTRKLFMAWKDGGADRYCILKPVTIDEFKCEGLKQIAPFRPDGPPHFPTAVNPDHGGYNIGDKLIPTQLPEPVYGFNVRFEYDMDRNIEYVVSAPLVGKTWNWIVGPIGPRPE